MERYFKVIAKCGHVGVNHYVPITFAVKANDRKDAINKVKWYPRVKHNNPNAILSINPIDFEQYEKILQINNEDPYLHAKCLADMDGVEGFEKRIRTNNKCKNITNVTKQFYKKINFKYKKEKMKLCSEIDYEEMEDLEYEYSL